jgi:hypothetical protein
MNAGPSPWCAASCSHFRGHEAISYGRGTWLFHMLRSMMRDPETTPGRRRGAAETQSGKNLIRARYLAERYEGKSITTREPLRVFEEQLPSSAGMRARNRWIGSIRAGSTVQRFQSWNCKR